MSPRYKAHKNKGFVVYSYYKVYVDDPCKDLVFEVEHTQLRLLHTSEGPSLPW